MVCFSDTFTTWPTWKNDGWRSLKTEFKGRVEASLRLDLFTFTFEWISGRSWKWLWIFASSPFHKQFLGWWHNPVSSVSVQTANIEGCFDGGTVNYFHLVTPYTSHILEMSTVRLLGLHITFWNFCTFLKMLKRLHMVWPRKIYTESCYQMTFLASEPSACKSWHPAIIFYNTAQKN